MIKNINLHFSSSLILMSISGLLFSTGANAEIVNNQTPVVQSSITTPTVGLVTPPVKYSYCPPESKLVLNKMFWGTIDGWRSYNESFVKEIRSFIGAQWTGVVLGKIICLYQGKEKNDFPVSLERSSDILVFEPKGPNWSARVEGYKLCASGNVFDCPFVTRQKTEVEEKDLYKQIQYQGGTNNDDF